MAKYIDREFLKKVAREYERGRPPHRGHDEPRRQAPGGLEHGCHRRQYDNPQAVDSSATLILASAAIPGLFRR